MLIRVIFQHF